jgi:hypothetical protein
VFEKSPVSETEMPTVRGPDVLPLLAVGAGVPQAATPAQSPIAKISLLSRVRVLRIVVPFSPLAMCVGQTPGYAPGSECQTAVFFLSSRA